jgi:TetR/AcrR family transcriptional regulator, cholesterol catabolism regulator
VSQKSNARSVPENGEPSRRERKADARRLAILRAAAAVFRDRGYEGAAMDEIAERLDMAKGNLYYYFKNKQELLFFCQDHSLDRLVANAQAILAGDEPEDEKLRRIVVGHVVCVLDELDGASAHTEVHALPDDLRAKVIAKRDGYEAVLRKLIQAGMRSGAFVATDAKMATLALLGALNGATRWYRPSGNLAPAAIGAAFADLFLDGLRCSGLQPQQLRRVK